MRRTIFVALVLGLAIVVSGYTVRRVFFDDTVAATGYLQPAATTELNFPSDGQITEIFVRTGDSVRAGQVLAKQDTTALEAELAAHESALMVAFGTQPSVDAADAAARAELSAAQAKAQQAVLADDASAVAARDAVEAARATLTVDQQQAAQWAATCDPNADLGGTDGGEADPPITAPAPSPVELGSCSQLAHRIAQGEASLSKAIGEYNRAVTRRESNADAQNAAILAAARQVEAANSRAALTVGSSATAVAQHAAAVAEARAAIDGAVIVAPSDGFVGGVNATPGEIAGPGGVRVFAPPQPLPQKEGGGIALFPQPAQQSTQPQSEARSLITLNSGAVKVVAQVSEADLDMVTERREAKVTFPALRNRSFSGLVTAIEPQAVNIDDRVYFLVDIALSEVPRASFSLRPIAANDPTVTTPVFGLTANVRF